jgi:hypothetical protein
MAETCRNTCIAYEIISAGHRCDAPQREHRVASSAGSPGRPSACASSGEKPWRCHLGPSSMPPFSSVCQRDQTSPEISRDCPTCVKVGYVMRGEVRTRLLAERRGSSTRVKARVRADLPSDHPVHSARIDGRREASRSKSILVMQRTAKRSPAPLDDVNVHKPQNLVNRSSFQHIT